VVNSEPSADAALGETAPSGSIPDDHDLPEQTIPDSDASEPPASLTPSEDEGDDDLRGHPTENLADQQEDLAEREKLDVELHPIPDHSLEDQTTPTQESMPELSSSPPPESDDDETHSPAPLYDDPSDEDDGEGEWITASNVGLHKSRALHLVPDEDTSGKTKKPVKQLGAGCMTADFAMQNVLLQMGLSLVGVEGKRIEKVKTWVLRCHACFK